MTHPTATTPTASHPATTPDPPTGPLPVVARPGPWQRVMAAGGSIGPTGRQSTFVVAVVVIAALTAALRLINQASAYDLFIDEIQYADVANSFAAGHGPELFGGPFFLHPPLFFGYLSLLQGGPSIPLTVGHVLALRPLVVPFAVLNALLVIFIARRFTGRRSALVAGLLYAADPFIVRFDSRVMLEAPTLTATLAGLLAALIAVERTGRARDTWLLLAGVAFGVAICTKSTSALITTVPLLLMVGFGVGPRRSEAAGVIAVQCAVYACYVAVVAAIGRFPDWFTQTLHGVVRATGAPQTGFTSSAAPSFADRLAARLGQFGPSYLLIVVAVGAIAVFVFEDYRSRGPGGRHSVITNDAASRLLTCWLGGMLVAIGYTTAFGELEEQTFYLMAVPSTIVIAVLAARTHTVAGKVVLWGSVAAVVAWSAVVWTGVHTTPDDAYRRMAEHLAPLAKPGTAIALGESTAQFVTPGFVIVPLQGSTAPAGARYALVSTELSRLRLSPITPEDIAALDRRYPLVFVTYGRTAGDLKLYDVSHQAAR